MKCCICEREVADGSTYTLLPEGYAHGLCAMIKANRDAKGDKEK